MRRADTASARWRQLDGERQSFIGRCEEYARYTLPKICLPTGYNHNADEASHDYQSVGAQAVNHLTNKIVLAAFAPSRPFFRADPDEKVMADMAELGVSEPQLAELLGQAERAAVAQLDRLGLRPKFYETTKHLIITGNCLMKLPEDESSAQVLGVKRYCVRRSQTGRIMEVLIRTQLEMDELEPAVLAYVKEVRKDYQDYRTVDHFEWVRRQESGDYTVEQWVDTVKLEEPRFLGKLSEEDFHQTYLVLTWDLSDGSHYGTGLVEDYKGDFAALSTLSQAQVMAAVLSSEFRWLVNPAGMTRPEDLEQSENGSALPGVEGDVVLIQSGKSADLQVTIELAADYVNRLGRGFLLGSAVTRQAERVTAEEIRMQAIELETSLGGVYSRLAGDWQLPMAKWLLKKAGIGNMGKGFTPVVVTGLEALSRSGDLEDLRLWLMDLAQVSALPEGLQMQIRFQELALALAAPRRVKVDTFLRSEEEMAAIQQQQLQEQQEAMAEQELVRAGANVAAKQGSQTE